MRNKNYASPTPVTKDSLYGTVISLSRIVEKQDKLRLKSFTLSFPSSLRLIHLTPYPSTTIVQPRWFRAILGNTGCCFFNLLMPGGSHPTIKQRRQAQVRTILHNYNDMKSKSYRRMMRLFPFIFLPLSL